MPTIRTIPLAATLVALAATAAVADVDLTVGPGAKIKGTLLPEGEVEIVRLPGQKFGTLDLTLAAKKRAPLDFTVRLFDPGGNEVPFLGDPSVQDAGKKVTARRFGLGATGEYRLEISAAGTGEYGFKMASKAAAKRTSSVSVDAGATTALEVSAPEGSSLAVTAKAAKGSPAVPRVISVGPLDTTATGAIKPTSHSVKVADSLPGGLFLITVRNDGQTGSIDVSVSVKEPKVKPVSFDVRAGTLGSPQGGETALAKLIGTGGGTVLVGDAGSSIQGAGVDVPAGAVGRSTLFSVSTTDPVGAPEGQQGAGPAVLFGPDGVQFGQAATVTVPYDPAKLPFGADPLTDLRVVRLSSDGTQTLITPTSVDLNNHTVTFPTSGFSRFMTLAPRGLPNLLGGSFWTLSVNLGFTPGVPRSGDSRDRELFVSGGTANFGAPDTPGAVALAAEERSIRFTHDDLGDGSVFTTDSPYSATANWTYDFQGPRPRVVVDHGSGDIAFLNPADTGSVLVSEIPMDPLQYTASIDMVLRRNPFPTTVPSIAGDYVFAGFQADVEGGPGPASLSLARFVGVMTLKADGTFTVKIAERSDTFDPVLGFFDSERESGSVSGTFAVNGPSEGIFEGAVDLLIPDDDPQGAPDRITLMPGADGQLLMGLSRTQGGDSIDAFFGVRLQRRATTQDIAGRYVGTSFVLGPNSYTVPSTTQVAGDLISDNFTVTYDFDGSSQVRFSDIGDRLIFRNDQVSPEGLALVLSSDSAGDTIPFKLFRDGFIVSPGLTGPVQGAASPAAGFMFLMEDPVEGGSFSGIELLVREPLSVQ